MWPFKTKAAEAAKAATADPAADVPLSPVQFALEKARLAREAVSAKIDEANAAIAGDDPHAAAAARAQLPILSGQMKDHHHDTVIGRTKRHMEQFGLSFDPSADADALEAVIMDAGMSLLADELTNDPMGFGYASMTDDEILSILNENRFDLTAKITPSPVQKVEGTTLAELFAHPEHGAEIKRFLNANAHQFIQIKFGVASPLIDPANPDTIETANAAGEAAAIEVFRQPRTPEVVELPRRLHAIWNRDGVHLPHSPTHVTKEMLAQARAKK